MTWQPIETYPKDGEQFLVTDGNSVIMAEAPNGNLVIHDITSCGFYSEHATSWMRLPATPDSEPVFKSAEPCPWGMIEVAA